MIEINYWIIMAPGLLGVAVYALIGIGNLIQDASNGDGGHNRRYQEFISQTMGRGASYAEAMDEWTVRTAFAKLRRTASDRINAINVADWYEHLDAAKKAAIVELAATRPDLIQPLAQMVESVSYGHIFYPAETAMIERHMKQQRESDRTFPTIDEQAALRIV